MKIIVIFLVAVLLYLFFITPRMVCRAKRSPFRDYPFYAHRGLFDNEKVIPENSLAAFGRAVNAGYGIELDVQLTKDDQLVVFHDAALKRMCGVEGNVWDYTLEELKSFRLKNTAEVIPTFEEALKLIDGRTPLIVEYKMDRPLTKVCELGNQLLRKYRGVYCIESFHPLALMWYRKHRPDVMRGQLSGKLVKREEGFAHNLAYFMVQNLLTNVVTRPDFIAYDYRYYRNFSRRICRWLGALPVAYTIKSREQYEKVKEEFELFIFDSCLL